MRPNDDRSPNGREGSDRQILRGPMVSRPPAPHPLIVARGLTCPLVTPGFVARWTEPGPVAKWVLFNFIRSGRRTRAW